MAVELASEIERREVLDLVPQKPPFRFVDEITELSESHIKASYLFTGEEFFYPGHFPGSPVTPGVILIESMAQAGLVALGIHILRKEDPNRTLRTLFSECTVEFLRVVNPGERVFIKGEKIFWRRNKLRSKVELSLKDGELAAIGTISGLGVEIS